MTAKAIGIANSEKKQEIWPSLVERRISRRTFLRGLGAVAGAVASLPMLKRVRALTRSDDPLKFIIVGGGGAGLCAAYELQNLGHECLILEADERHIGGRARTLRFADGLYGEAGAMRIPLKHDLTRHYVAEFDLSLRPFINTDPKAYYVGRGLKVRAEDVHDLASRYDLAPNEAGMTPDELYDASIGAIIAGLSEAEKADLFKVTPEAAAVRALDLLSLSDGWKQAGLSLEAQDYLEIVHGNEQFIHTGLTTRLREDIFGLWPEPFDEIVGGTATDLISGSTYYPSDNAEARDAAISAGPGVLLASYTWGEQARRLAGLGAKERTDVILDAVGSFHPELQQPGMVRRTATWSWDLHPLSQGAFSFFLPGQHSDLYADIISPEGRIYFAGEHASLNHGWMQGSFESALRAVDEMLADR